MTTLRGPLVGAAAIVVRDGRVLLGERQGAHGEGEWAFPGGKVDPGEDAAETVRRELTEETGLVATEVRAHAWTTDLFPADGLHYVTLHHLVEAAPGEPELREPDKCRGWGWFTWAALPEPLFAPVENLRRAGRLPTAPGPERGQARDLTTAELMTWWRDRGRREMRQVLLWRWDPIGVADSFPNAADEYDGYAGTILAEVRTGASIGRLARLLGAIERERMGSPTATLHRERVAEQLVHWYEESRRAFLEGRPSGTAA